MISLRHAIPVLLSGATIPDSIRIDIADLLRQLSDEIEELEDDKRRLEDDIEYDYQRIRDLEDRVDELEGQE